MSDEVKLKTVLVRAHDGGEEVIDGVESIEFPVSAPGQVTFTLPTGSSVRLKTIPRGEWLDGRHEVEVTGTATSFAVVEDALWREGLPFEGEKPHEELPWRHGREGRVGRRRLGPRARHRRRGQGRQGAGARRRDQGPQARRRWVTPGPPCSLSGSVSPAPGSPVTLDP